MNVDNLKIDLRSYSANRLRVAALLLGVMTAAPAAAQQPTLHDQLLDNMEGAWVITGTIAHAATTHDLTADWVMNHQYLRLHEVSRERDGAGRPRYEAMVFIGWVQASATYACVWLDVFGGITAESIGTAPRDGNRIAFAFANHGHVTLRNTMTWHPESRSWDWQIVNVHGRRLSTFATLTLRHP
jgi:hypothetical protein